MITRISAIYRDGVFVPDVALPLANETTVDLLIEEHQHPVTEELTIYERQQLRRAVVSSMRRRNLSTDAPRLTRDQLHDRR